MNFYPDKLLTPQIKAPAHLLPWLECQSPLTEKLLAETGDAQLRLISQHWTLPNWWDRFALGITTPVFQRKILMQAKNAACWFARTIIPEQPYHAHSLFKRLDTEPLGKIIFNEPTILRKSLVHYEINDQSIEYYWITRDLMLEKTKCWVRLSEFKIAEASSFYLIEIILPGLERVLNELG